jgi:mono/diheme cytochrome c family protein
MGFGLLECPYVMAVRLLFNQAICIPLAQTRINRPTSYAQLLSSARLAMRLYLVGAKMNKWVKRTSIALAALALLGVAATVVGKALGERKMARNVVLQVRALDVVPDPTRIEQGRYLYNTRGCAECHGADGAGKAIIQDGGMRVVAPNITAGPNGHDGALQGGRLGAHRAPWRQAERQPRHDHAQRGLQPPHRRGHGGPGRLPPADAPVPGKCGRDRRAGPGEGAVRFGMIQDASEKIDHAQAPAHPVAAAVTPEYGAYVANGCIGCHGAALSGGRIPARRRPGPRPPT